MSTPFVLDRYTQLGELAVNTGRLIKLSMIWLIMVVCGGCLWMAVNGYPGVVSFALMSVATCLSLDVWRRFCNGLPMLPMLTIQHFVIFGLPLVTGHEVTALYPESYLTKSGLEVLTLLLSMTVFWRIGMQLFQPSPPVSLALHAITHEGMPGLGRLGFKLVLAGTAYQVLLSLNVLAPLIDILPSGSYPIILAMSAAVTACGFFLTAMIVGTKSASSTKTMLFWGLLAVNCLIFAADFLLSSTTTLVASVFIGLFWSSGRIPWRYLTMVVLVLSFLNLGKFSMRERYWGEDAEERQPTKAALLQMPKLYLEWVQVSTDALTGNQTDARSKYRNKSGKGQSLTERVNNLQNLLYVIDAMEVQGTPPLGGKTYSIIPPLLIPRIFWAAKPRTHEGQIMLNIHFGRQDLNATYQTAIAWGLLPEAYGNFGAYMGSLYLGAALGFAFAWLENRTCRKAIFSLEGFVSFGLFMGTAASFEMVASVLVTSVFQSLIPIAAATYPFVRRMTLVRPDDVAQEDNYP